MISPSDIQRYLLVQVSKYHDGRQLAANVYDFHLWKTENKLVKLDILHSAGIQQWSSPAELLFVCLITVNNKLPSYYFLLSTSTVES